MDHAVAMSPRERIGELAEDPAYLGRRQASFEAQPFGERLAAHVSHDEVPEAVDFAEAVEREDPRMRELRGDARLATKPLTAFGRLGEVGSEDLYGNEPLERALASEVDRTHAAASQRSHDLVLRSERALDDGA